MPVMMHRNQENVYRLLDPSLVTDGRIEIVHHVIGSVDHAIGAKPRVVADGQPSIAVDIAADVKPDAIAHLDLSAV